MEIRINERIRTSELSFSNIAKFAEWVKDQAFNPGESIEFLTDTH